MRLEPCPSVDGFLTHIATKPVAVNTGLRGQPDFYDKIGRGEATA